MFQTSFFWKKKLICCFTKCTMFQRSNFLPCNGAKFKNGKLQALGHSRPPGGLPSKNQLHGADDVNKLANTAVMCRSERMQKIAVVAAENGILPDIIQFATWAMHIIIIKSHSMDDDDDDVFDFWGIFIFCVLSKEVQRSDLFLRRIHAHQDHPSSFSARTHYANKNKQTNNNNKNIFIKIGNRKQHARTCAFFAHYANLPNEWNEWREDVGDFHFNSIINHNITAMQQ